MDEPIMTDLQAAIARLTADDAKEDVRLVREYMDTSYADIVYGSRLHLALMRIADAYLILLDARPITAEGLKERGFGERRTQLCNRYSRGDLECAMWDGGLTVWRLEDATLPDKLQPQTQGDLTTLLLRLARGME